MTIKITFFAHGTTTDNENGISTGWDHGELSNLGVEQSKKLKELIKDKKFDVVFCSDLKRSVDSTKPTFGKSVPIIKDKRLRECNYGDLNGAKSDIVGPLAEKSIDKPFPKGESYKEVEKRIRGFLEYLLKKYNGKSVAIVAHKATQLALDVIIKKKTWEQAFDEDWRKTKSWKPGWDYLLEKL